MRRLKKSLMIDMELHKRIKIYCAQKGKKINEWIKLVAEKEINKK